MIRNQYEWAIDRTAGQPLPENFTKQNLVDLGKLKLEAAKSLTLSIVRRRNGHDGTEETQEAFSIEEAMTRLDDIELRLAQLIDLEGGLDGVS